MKIIDESGKVYQVNDEEKLVTEVDNDMLLDVLKHTYFGHKLEIILNSMVKDDSFDNYPFQDVSDGIDYLTKILSERVGDDKVQKIIDEVDNHLKVKKIDE